MTTTTKAATFAELLNSACTDEDLVSAILTKIANDNYPGNSFKALIEEIRQFSPELAEAISENGVEFKAVAEGCTYSATGWEETSTFGIDLEEWLQDIPKEIRSSVEEFDEELTDARENFAGALHAEITNHLEKLGVTAEEMLEHFRTYGTLNPEDAKVGRFWMYTGNHSGGHDCPRNGEVDSGLAMKLYYSTYEEKIENVVTRKYGCNDFGCEVSVAAPQSVWDAIAAEAESEGKDNE